MLSTPIPNDMLPFWELRNVVFHSSSLSLSTLPELACCRRCRYLSEQDANLLISLRVYVSFSDREHKAKAEVEAKGKGKKEIYVLPALRWDESFGCNEIVRLLPCKKRAEK
jgi:hypothetical protein